MQDVLLQKVSGWRFNLPGTILFSIKKSKSNNGENLIWTFWYLQGGYQKDRARLFTVTHGQMPRGNGHKLKEKMFWLDVRRKSFTLRTVKQWKRLPRKAAQSLHPWGTSRQDLATKFFLIAAPALALSGTLN